MGNQAMIVIAFILFCFTARAGNIDLFVLAGQSNALGVKGNANEYPHNDIDSLIRLNYTDLLNGSSNGWGKMHPQSGLFPNGYFGLEVTFSRLAYNHGYNAAVFKYGQAGTSIFVDWKTPGSGGIWDGFMTDLATAIQELEAQGHTVTVRALIWVQGESDALAWEWIGAYKNNLLSLIADFRSLYDCPVILGADEAFPIYTMPYIVQYQNEIANEIPMCVRTSMTGLPKADETHLTPVGVQRHGERIWAAYDSIAGKPTIIQEAKAKQLIYPNPSSGLITTATGSMHLERGVYYIDRQKVIIQ